MPVFRGHVFGETHGNRCYNRDMPFRQPLSMFDVIDFTGYAIVSSVILCLVYAN